MGKSRVLALVLLASGCPKAEDEGLADEAASESDSTDSTGADSTGADSTGSECSTSLTGYYLLALQTSLDPEPVLAVLTIEATVASDCSAVATMSLQVLDADHVFLGAPYVAEDVAIDTAGNFEVALDEVTLSADPVIGNFAFDGHVVHVDALCGDLSGMLTVPLEYDLAGSTFAAIRLDDDGSNPATLPSNPPHRCSDVPPL